MLRLVAIVSIVFAVTAAHAAPAPDKDAALKANEQAKAENALLVKAMAALNAKKWQEAETLLLQIAATDKSNWQVERSLGDAEFNLAKYEAAVAAFGKAITLAAAAAKATPPDTAAKAELAPILTAQGNAYLELKKDAEAKAAYTRAVTLDPHYALASFNLCAVDYNAGDTKGALAACNKAIAADPKNAAAYFIAGSIRYADATVGADGKMVVPAEALKALRKCLELEPAGAHAADVKAMLEAAGEPIATTSKPSRNETASMRALAGAAADAVGRHRRQTGRANET